jgi:hypothetical protein
MIRGQCLCGAVQYQVNQAIEQSILCFCQDCRQAQGSMFAWNSPIQKHSFQLLKGAESLKEYFHSSHKARVFCMNCASPIYSYRLDLPDILRLRLGTVTQGDLPAPVELAYTENQPDYLCIVSE